MNEFNSNYIELINFLSKYLRNLFVVLFLNRKLGKKEIRKL